MNKTSHNHTPNKTRNEQQVIIDVKQIKDKII